jgi:hypothetical protein
MVLTGLINISDTALVLLPLTVGVGGVFVADTDCIPQRFIEASLLDSVWHLACRALPVLRSSCKIIQIFVEADLDEMYMPNRTRPKRVDVFIDWLVDLYSTRLAGQT